MIEATPRLTKQDLLKWANNLPDDAIILSQVRGQSDPGAWSMWVSFSDELTHFKWEGPVFCISMEHPGLESVNPNVKWND